MLSALYLMHAGVRKTWYIQEQQLVQYQQLDDLYCVAATYSLENATVPFFSGTVGGGGGSQLRQRRRREWSNQNKNNMTLCARAVNAQDSSRLAVAPCFLPNILAGPYLGAWYREGERRHVAIGSCHRRRAERQAGRRMHDQRGRHQR